MREIRFLLLAVILAACFALQPAIVLANEITVQPEAGVSDVLANEFRDITAKVAQFYQEVYGYTPLLRTKVIIVPNELSYAEALQREGTAKEDAIRRAKSSGGVSLGSRQIVIICADKNVNYFSRMRTVTHELFHQMQAELREGSEPHQWLVEGTARAAEFAMLEWLGAGSLGAEQHKLVNLLVNAKIKADPRDMATGGPKWLNLMEQKMYPYEVAELMTIHLINKAGKPALVQYFRYLGKSGRSDSAFQRAFGISYDQFINDYRTFMQQAEAAIGRTKFESEGGMNPEEAQAIINNGKTVEQMLWSQGWTFTKSPRFVLVPNQDAMLRVMRREMAQTPEEKLTEMARRGPIALIGEMSYVVDAGRLPDATVRISTIAWFMSQNAMTMTARPAPANSIQWIYAGTVKVLVAKALETAGIKTVAESRQDWITLVQKSRSYPTLAEIKSQGTPAYSRYGTEVVWTTGALAVQLLVEKTSHEKLLQYFVVMRDLNDAARAFQQVFGMSVEAFDIEFGSYMKSLK